MARLHLIDATYELFRAFYAIPSILAPDGREVGAVYGLLSSVVSLLRDPTVTHLACATDHVIESFRNRLFAGYKTGDGIPPPLHAQFPLAEAGLRALGVVVWPMVDFEADDALAAAAWRHAPVFEQVVVATPDKDLAQVVSGKHVVLWDRRRETVYDEAGVLAKWGVPPRLIPDLLALIGDTADGIPGIPGWGAKSSAAALVAHGSLDAIPDDPAAWKVKVRGADRLAASLALHREAARLYRTLATLRADVPLAEGPEQLLYRGAPRAEFEAFCASLGFKTLAARPTRWRDEAPGAAPPVATPAAAPAKKKARSKPAAPEATAKPGKKARGKKARSILDEA